MKISWRRTVVIVSVVLLTIIILIAIIGHKSKSNTNSHIPANGNYSETSYNTEDGIVTIEDELFDITCGYTFYLSKGNLQLFADIVPTLDGSLMITGREIHMDKELSRGLIKERFSLQTDGTFTNEAGTIIVKYTGYSATFTDNRTDIELPFEGELKLLLSEVGYETNISTSDDSISLGTVNIATRIDDLSENSIDSLIDGVIVDEYSESGSTSEIVVKNNFEDLLVSSNERKVFTITAKFIENASNSGTKYKEINTELEFYAFGAKFPYDSSVCNTVTLQAVYRGNEKHFNGLQMDGEYPCFVINSIRKPTEDEVSN